MLQIRKALLTVLLFITIRITNVESFKKNLLHYLKNYNHCDSAVRRIRNRHTKGTIRGSQNPISNVPNGDNREVYTLPISSGNKLNYPTLKNNTYEEAFKIISEKLETLKGENTDNVEHMNTFSGFLKNYFDEMKRHKSCPPEIFLENFLKYIESFKKYRYYTFPNVHRYDESLHEWSLQFWSQLIDKENSKFRGTEHIEKMEKWIEQGHNIIIFSNHHIEADANIIKYFFHIHNANNISRKIIFIGGHKIRADPLSRPFSVSANLLCIYSKKYIENPPELKEEKIMFNHKSLNALKNLLTEGRNIIWLAPSGGRDRKDPHGKIKISTFDPKIIQTFYILAKRAKVRTHFIGLALNTYNICPPPNTVDVDEIEKHRSCAYSPVGLILGEDIFDVYPTMDEKEITEKLYTYVNRLYSEIC
ncbi:glycerol-3-phosphate 1-O-acyltransferase, putative [Plasmodium knowlesi strain H]|uniref:Glycerol-3-phosphate 1-O-acyltransferase, putative n=3 Tax=Plasmodium knowlesi TaxID=5850 RepID=A0A5K1UKU1_PLAKH|nr:glycerol-3-phosphate 1-O-acyltransferase, putative [Plasmodium knowlesi strain H]OTN63942.1 putative Glycerol-3-phosphate 1-O-acyltransferase [Plasmodium knowlesi]CAA9990789.1 glycerol-3-phosphate 1-O-acyltransferase, putative [Plasmodium knowlesi strain H]SBO21072.1 glycerol-3-phosphate 1-O-acyltransferase, putative [Plasmodium knowlesi strain H]SBO21553.1 glycerol-3-phosphate 1-O-acyltransferase, putative [Plasmodium knowlesi strain H]VVS80263.1 glycerol-3-phosphate 1-O-acyltransferase, p|eukprot:XP_002262078.1 glycerol-3-phosphate acyltransferase, putative [Plasmodium knowlesi strain H]